VSSVRHGERGFAKRKLDHPTAHGGPAALVESLTRGGREAPGVLGSGAMTTSPAVADVPNKSVSFEGTTYTIQELGEDNFTVLVKGVPVGRIVYTFGAPNGVPEGDAASEDTLYAVAEAWFTATA